MHRIIVAGLALYSYFLIKSNLPRLPERIPTHFNAAGEANAWGSPNTLWFLLVIQVLICGLLLAMPLIGARFPRSVNLGRQRLSDFTPEVQERIMPLFADMMGWMSVLIGLLLTVLLKEIIQASSSPHPHFDPRWELGIFVAGTLVVLIVYMRRIYAVTSQSFFGS